MSVLLTPPLEDAIRQFLGARGATPCLLLVTPDVVRLERVAADLDLVYGWPRLSVGGGLSAALLHEPPARYPDVAATWLQECTGEHQPGPALLTEIDLLFEPALRLDPLALLRRTSRTVRLFVAWPGSYAGDVLRYGAPGHAHYRLHAWSRPDVRIAQLD